MRLKSWTVYITRPAHQAEALSLAVTALGASVVHIPMLHIESNDSWRGLWNQPTAQAKDLAIFSSPNAVQYSEIFWNIQGRLPQAIAVGESTAQALREKGWSSVCVPKIYCMDAVLNLPILRNVQGKSIWICCGFNSRFLSHTLLSERGAHIKPVVCYRAVAAKTPDHCPFSKDTRTAAVVVTSREILKYWHDFLLRIHADFLKKALLVVVRDEHLNTAHDLGFHHVVVSRNPSTSAIAECLSSIIKKE